MAAPLNSQQAAERFVALAHVPADEQAALREAMVWLLRLARAETCLAITLDLLQVERAMSDQFEC